MASEEGSYTLGCMIRGYHVYMDVWSSYTGEVLYYCFDERSAEGTAVESIIKVSALLKYCRISIS